MPLSIHEHTFASRAATAGTASRRPSRCRWTRSRRHEAGTQLHPSGCDCGKVVPDGLSAVVVSIGKLATGQANYYLDQAQRRVDRATSVGSGIEDYYVGGTESPGY